MPVFAIGGIGVPALQSLATQQAGEDQQGQLQGVLASIVSLASIIGPLLFAGIYFAVRDTWPGLIWIAGIIVYTLAIPLIFRLRAGPKAAEPA